MMISGEGCYREVARHILSRHAPPDLRGAVVLLPNFHAAAPLAQALSQVAGMPALLPLMTTLSDWAETVQPATSIQSDTQRLATLYQALRERDWFPGANLWSLSRELLALMDELTCHHVDIPDSAEAFTRQLSEAYQARAGQAMQFEARVVHELWYAMAASGEPDAQAIYQQKLGLLAQQVTTPLYVLLTCDMPVPEARFIAACREHVEVTIFDLRDMVNEDSACALLTSALQQEQDSQDLRSLACAFNTGSLRERINLFGAHGLEQEAQAADVAVRRWLLEGRQNIAVVVQDRLVARRLRALLERAQVQVQDETGWTFATLSVSTVLMRWLEALQGDFYYLDVLDLLKSPYLFSENHAQRKQAAYQFEQLVRRHGVVAHLQDYIELAEKEAIDLIQPLARLRQAARVLQGAEDRRLKTGEKRTRDLSLATHYLPLSSWLQALHGSLEILGVIEGWRQDAAGQQLLQLLSLWQDELQSDTTSCSFSEWRRWLSQQLDLNTYRDVGMDSPVLFTHLAATRWRGFDAVLLLGCDAAHLPAPVNAGQWFNDAVRATLGLPLSHAQQRKVRDDLLCLLAVNDNVRVTWQASCNGEVNLLSPYFEMLRAQHLLAFGDDLMDMGLGEMLAFAQVQIQDSDRKGLMKKLDSDYDDKAVMSSLIPRTTKGLCPKSLREGCGIQDAGAMPRPVISPELIPTSISPSGYNALMACPYQYFARHVLRLNELDEVREALDKRDYGTWVHAVLQRFHAEVPLLQAQDRGVADAVLQRISSVVFAEGTAHDYLAQAWLLRWQSQIPAYLDWQLQNEAAGWRYQGSEVPFSIDLTENLTLRGRLDRVDVNQTGERRVLDYKTQSVTVLKNKLKAPGEDVQLACYVQAVDACAAEFVSLENEVVQAVASPDEITELAQRNVERLKTIFTQLREGAGMPAHGAENVCAYCEMRGLCRRGEWEVDQDRGLHPQGAGRAVPVVCATTATLRIEDRGANG